MIRTPTAVANAGLDAKYDRADAGAGPAVIKVYSGSQPSTGDTAATGTLLVTFTCANPAWAPAASRSKALDADPDLSAVAAASGTPGWARMEDSDGNAIFDGSVATSGADFTIDTASITSGQTVLLTAGTITDPA